MCGIQMRIGYNFKKRGRFLTHRIDLPDGYRDMHVAEYYLALVRFLNIKPASHGLDLFLSHDDVNRADELS